MPTHTGRQASGGLLSGRPGLRSLLRSLLVSTVVVVGYFVLPLTSAVTVGTTLFLLVGLGLVTGLLVWQIRSIVRSPYPLARAVGAMAVTIPLFLIVFATSYLLVGQVDAGNWSEPLNRMDAIYFAVTVFATVGFGDITAVSGAARAMVTLQMVGNIVLIGLATRVIVRAVQTRLDGAVRDRLRGE